MKENEKIEEMEKSIMDMIKNEGAVGFWKNNNYMGILFEELLEDNRIEIEKGEIAKYKLFLVNRKNGYTMLIINFDRIS